MKLNAGKLHIQGHQATSGSQVGLALCHLMISYHVKPALFPHSELF